MVNHVSAPETARLLGLRPAAAILVALLGVAAAMYFPWRLGTFNPEAPILSGVVFAAELLGLFSLALHIFMTTKLTQRTPRAPIDNVKVDLFVTTYNEPVSMLRRTLAAAKQVRRATRVVLLDDGNRAEMKKLAFDMDVDYIARADNTHAKAGNLNNALTQSTADFVATFDADHAPAPDFLEQTLGYFRNEHVAFVQTPQDFYNLDSFQHRRFGKTNRFWTEQSLFFRVVQPGKDRWNAAFYCGSCAVLRRVALNQIGGFATGTVTEDLHTSLKLHKAGYASVYHNVSLAYGIAPSSYEPYETQRVRWGQGAMQVWRKEGVVFAPGLTLAQRACYLASIITYFDAWQKLVFYILPALVLMAGVMPVASMDWEFLARFLPWFTLSMLAGEELGRGYARSLVIEQYNFLRMPAFLRASFSLFIPRNLGFNVTRKDGKADSARGQLAAMAILPALCFLAIPVAIWRYNADAHLPLGALTANIVWAIVLGLTMAIALRFAWKRTSDRRTDYRFVAPLPFDVHLPSGGYGTLRALDLTPEGVRLAAPMGLDLSVGQKIDAMLRLPDGKAPVTLRIRHREVIEDDPLPKRMEIGAAITWRAAPDQDRLNALLFGAGLEQHLLDVTEQGGTPLDLIGEGEAKPETNDIRRAWAPGVVEHEGAMFDVAAQPLNDNFDSWRVLSYEPVPNEAVMRLPRPGAGETGAPVRVIKARPIQTGEGAMHVASIELAGAAPVRAVKRAGGDPWLMVGAAVMLAVALISTAATAHGQTIGLAGAEGGANSTYAYVGAVQPLKRERDGSGWAARVWLDSLNYTYEQAGTEIEAESFGGEAALVRQWSGEWGWANASVGARYRHTTLEPGDPTNPSEGGHWDAALQFDGRTALHERWGMIWLAAYQLEQRDSMVRVGVDREIGRSSWRFGAEAARMWGRRYGENQLGLRAEVRMTDTASLSFRAGASRTDDDESGGYVGLGLSLSLQGDASGIHRRR